MSTSQIESVVSILTSGSIIVHPLVKPENINNCCVYSLISTNPINSMTKNLTDKIRVQIDCYGNTLDASLDLADRVRGLLDLNETDFMLGRMINQMTMVDSETNTFRSVLDFYIY